MAEPISRYSGVSLTLHWLTAILLVGQIVLVTMAEDAEGSARGQLMMLHKSGGMAILILTLARIGWRIGNPAIVLPAAMPQWERWLARGVQVLFYVALIALPLTGWIAGSASQRGFEFYGLFNVPLLPIGGGKEVSRSMMDIHELVVKGLYVLLFLHIVGALKHHFVNKDNVLRRMLPFLKERAE